MNIIAVTNPKMKLWVIPRWVKIKSSGARKPITKSKKSKSIDMPPKPPDNRSLTSLNFKRVKIAKGTMKWVNRSI